jgi:hypothetical protein
MLMTPIQAPAPDISALEEFLKSAKSARLSAAEQSLIAARDTRKELSGELEKAALANRHSPNPRMAQAVDALDLALKNADKQIAAALANLQIERADFAAQFRQDVRKFLGPTATAILVAIETIDAAIPAFLAVERFEATSALSSQRPMLSSFPSLSALRETAARLAC